MKKLSFLLVLIFVSSELIFGQTIIWELSNFYQSNNVNFVHFSAKRGWIWVGTYGDGLFLSTDKGETWVDKSNGLTNKQIFAFAEFNDTLYVGTLAGVFKSTDLGNNWVAKNNGLTDTYVNYIAVTKDRRILVGTLYSGLFISSDFGESWTQMQNAFSSKSVNFILPKSDGFVFVGTTSGLFRATLLFDFWGKVDADLKDNNNINAIAVDSSGNIYVGTNNGMIFKSMNNGVNWVKMFEISNASIQRIVVSPRNVIFATTFGKGVFRSKDFGATWEEVNDGLYNPYVTSLAFLPNNRLVVSSWGNGLFFGTEYPISTYVEGEYCTNSEIAIDYLVTQEFNDDNYFIAQLSSPNGKFDNPIELGRVNSKTSGTILARIPQNVSTGILYRIRVVSTSPQLIGADNRKNIKIYKGLNPMISGKASVCVGDIEVYSTQVKPGVLSLWRVVNGDILAIDDTNMRITVQWNSIGEGAVVLSQSLADGTCPDSITIKVKVNPKPPKPYITRVGYSLVSSSPTGNQWFLFGQPIEGATSDTLRPEQPGLYTVQVTNEFGCVSAMSDTFDFYWNSVDVASEHIVSIFPNPSNSVVSISFNSDELPVSFIIENSFGINLSPRIVYVSNPKLWQIDFSGYPSGTFFIKFYFKDFVIVRKILIVK